MGVIHYAYISRMLTNSNTLEKSNRESDFGSEDDYRPPPRIFDSGRFRPFFGLKAKFGHICVDHAPKKFFRIYFRQSPLLVPIRFLITLMDFEGLVILNLCT